MRLVIDNKDCVRCTHCLNVVRGGLLPGKERGVTILVGGKGVLKIGATMGTVIVPFMKLETEEDFEKLKELARNVLDFFAENALEHERVGETWTASPRQLPRRAGPGRRPAHDQRAAQQPLRAHRRLGRGSGEVDRAQAGREERSLTL